MPTVRLRSPGYKRLCEFSSQAVQECWADRGHLHRSGRGHLSQSRDQPGLLWFEFARKILDQAGLDDITIAPIPSSALDRRARRPRNSRLANTRLEASSLSLLPPWKDAVRSYDSRTVQAQEPTSKTPSARRMPRLPWGKVMYYLTSWCPSMFSTAIPPRVILFFGLEIAQASNRHGKPSPTFRLGFHLLGFQPQGHRNQVRRFRRLASHGFQPLCPPARIGTRRRVRLVLNGYARAAAIR
jgi:hypothetical protein